MFDWLFGPKTFSDAIRPLNKIAKNLKKLAESKEFESEYLMAESATLSYKSGKAQGEAEAARKAAEKIEALFN